MENDVIEIKGLEQIMKSLKGKPPMIRIGVLGGGARSSKNSKGITNATVGAVHEFGAPNKNIPQRSFLRIPLTENLQKEMEASGLFTQEISNKVIKSGSVKPWLEKVGVCAQSVVLDAFESSGDGKWPKWKNPNYKNEGGMLLVDTQQLRDSLTWDIK